MQAQAVRSQQSDGGEGGMREKEKEELERERGRAPRHPLPRSRRSGDLLSAPPHYPLRGRRRPRPRGGGKEGGGGAGGRASHPAAALHMPVRCLFAVRRGVFVCVCVR